MYLERKKYLFKEESVKKFHGQQVINAIFKLKHRKKKKEKKNIGQIITMLKDHILK